MNPGPYPMPEQPVPSPVTRPERPSSVSIASELWALVVLAQTIAYFAQWSFLTDQAREQLRSFEEQQGQTLPDAVVPVAVIAAGLIMAVIFAQLIWALRLGYTPLRLLGIFFAAYVIVETCFRLFGSIDPKWAMVPTVISGVAALGVIAALAHSDTVKYCTEMSAFRKGKRNR